jgi:hypothetical protein
MLTKVDYDLLVKQIKEEFPDFEIVPKNSSKFMKILNLLLKVITFGKMNRFMTDYTTTIGHRIYTSSEWENRSITTQLSTLRHERVHMRQAKKYGRFLYSLLYLLLPVPVGFAFFRAKFEMEAYEETLRAMHEFYGPTVFTKTTKEVILGYFTGPDYFWMWPWRSNLEAWYDNFVDKLLRKT